MGETLRSANTSTKPQWIAAQARKHPDRVFTSVHHLIDGEWMRGAWRRTRKDGAAGIDGVTAADYEKNLEANLEDLSPASGVGANGCGMRTISCCSSSISGTASGCWPSSASAWPGLG